MLFLPAPASTLVGTVFRSSANCEKSSWTLQWVMLWNWVWFVQQVLEHLLPDEAGETTLRHLSPTQLWDDSPVVKLLHIDNFAALALSQAEADGPSARMLRRLQTAGVVARTEKSSDALLGVELVESGTCWRPSPKKFWRIALAFRELAFGRCRRADTQISRPSGTQCLCSDCDVMFSSMHTNL